MSGEHTILLARQPIYDHALRVIAYELLYRPQPGIATDGDTMTSEVIWNAFNEVGLRDLTDQKPAYINFTRRLLMEIPPFQPADVVIEVLETIDPDAEVVAAAQRLVDAGFTLALDDFVPGPRWEPLVKLARVVKIDVLNTPLSEVERLVAQFKRDYPQLLLVAEKVENIDMLSICRDLGFHLFQGYFLCKPQPVAGRKTMAGNKLALLEVLAELQSPDADFPRIETLISRDASLSYAILRIINSAQYAHATVIESVRHAINLLGLRAIRGWATVLALSKLSDKPSDLLVTGMVRGKFCELLAEHAGLATESAFTVGLFSVLDALLDRPMQELLTSLPLREDLKWALLTQSGDLGKLLRCIFAYEQGNWQDAIWSELPALSVNEDEVLAAYLEAVRWANDCNHMLQAGH